MAWQAFLRRPQRGSYCNPSRLDGPWAALGLRVPLGPLGFSLRQAFALAPHVCRPSWARQALLTGGERILAPAG